MLPKTDLNQIKAKAKLFLIGNYDLYERERNRPQQLTLFDFTENMRTEEINNILKERIIGCKIRN